MSERLADPRELRDHPLGNLVPDMRPDEWRVSPGRETLRCAQGLTEKGRTAPLHEWSDPLWPLYHYPREKRSARKRRLYHVPPRQRGRPRKAS